MITIAFILVVLILAVIGYSARDWISLVYEAPLGSIKGILLFSLSYISKFTLTIGGKSEFVSDRFQNQIKSVIDPVEARELRDEIASKLAPHVKKSNDIIIPAGTHDARYLRVRIDDKVGSVRDQLSRGEFIMGLILAVVGATASISPRLGQITITSIRNYNLTIGRMIGLLVLIFTLVLLVAVSVRLVVIDQFAYQTKNNPEDNDVDDLLGKWGWNAWMLPNTAVLVIILGLTSLEKWDDGASEILKKNMWELIEEREDLDGRPTKEFVKRVVPDLRDYFRS